MLAASPLPSAYEPFPFCGGTPPLAPKVGGVLAPATLAWLAPSGDVMVGSGGDHCFLRASLGDAIAQDAELLDLALDEVAPLSKALCRHSTRPLAPPDSRRLT